MKCMKTMGKVSVLLIVVMLLGIFGVNSSTYRAEAASKISLNKKSAYLIKGQTFQLKLSNAKAKNITWTTSKKSVATVSKGKVTTKKKGKATITAKYNKKNYKCVVNVETPKISKTSMTLNCGSSSQLKVNDTKQKVIWSSNDKNIVTVNSNGKIKGVAVGTTNVIGRVGNKNYTCKVTVNPIFANKIILSHTDIKLYKGETIDIYATVLPSDTANRTITWKSSNNSVATIDSKGKITASGIGKATITATCGSKTATCLVTVNKIDVQSIEITYMGEKIKGMQREIGYSAHMDVNIYPYNATTKEVSWKSSNPKVADFYQNTNMLMPLAAGTTTITATVDGKSTSIEFTVNMPIEFDFTFDKRDVDIKINNLGKYSVIMDASVKLLQGSYSYNLYRGYSLQTGTRKVMIGGQMVYENVYSFYSSSDTVVSENKNTTMSYSLTSTDGELSTDKNIDRNITFEFFYGNTTYKANLTSAGDFTYEIIESIDLW